MIGQILIHALFGTAIASTVLYAWASFKEEATSAERIARILFLVTALGLVAALSMLAVNIVNHRFEFTYVWNYSSKELPLHLLLACTYSGQEGSFLLWTSLVAVIGVILTPYARRHGYEAPVLLFFGAILSFLTLLLVAKNPFAYYIETFASSGVTEADIPPNGRGLNPLLHNAWITIHPPILFTGFASMSVSFTFAMAGLLRREYHRWIDVALPWTLFATAILGFGIMLGGFWAYETLGWGGFWGWDPVENSSLIPWLVSVALVHTMLVQKRTRGLVKTNMLLAVISFVMVLYSTFLTRSGILGDTSVHSFVDPGRFAFVILFVFMVTFILAGAALVLWRRKDMDIHREEFKTTTREFMLSIGSALIMASAVFVTIGTSWPVFMEIVGQPKVAVAVEFYDKIHLIIVPAILLVNALSLVFLWRNTPRTRIRGHLTIAAVVATVPTIAMVALGIRTIEFIILSYSAWFSLVVNARVGWTLLTRSAATAGAYVSHTGIALLIFGVITTSSYTESHHVMLVHGEPVHVGEFTLTYLGKEQVEKHFKDREKFRYHVRIEHGASSTVVAPVLYRSDFNKRSAPFLEPGIRWGVFDDYYIAPKATDREDVYRRTTVQRGTTIAMPLDSSVSITLERFTMPMEEGAGPDGRMRMSAVLQIRTGVETVEVRARTNISTGSEGPSFEPEWAPIPNSSFSVGLASIERNNEDPSKSTGDLIFMDTSKPQPVAREIFTIDFSVKPLISLVWAGVITMVLGFGFSIVRTSRSTQKELALSETELAPAANGEVQSIEEQGTDAYTNQT